MAYKQVIRIEISRGDWSSRPLTAAEVLAFVSRKIGSNNPKIKRVEVSESGR